MATSMFGRRSVGDPWYTALYQDPAQHWWLPGPCVGAGVIVGSMVVDSSVELDDLVIAGLVTLFMTTVSYFSFRRDNA